MATGFEHLTGAVEIHAHALVEILLGLAADDGRQVKHRRGIRVDQLIRRIGLAEVAVSGFQSLVGGERLRRRRDVRDQNFVDLRLVTARGSDAAALEQRFDEPRSEKTRSTGDHYPHGFFPAVLSRWRVRR